MALSRLNFFFKGGRDAIISGAMTDAAAAKYTLPTVVTAPSVDHTLPPSSDPTFNDVVNFITSSASPASPTSGGGANNSPPSPSPSPPPPCFPNSAIVIKADGTRTRMDALQHGDVIVAATATGTLTTDTVSLFSLADDEAVATVTVLSTDTNVSLALTPTHRLPVGPTCCAHLKQALDVSAGEIVWTVAPSDSHRVAPGGKQQQAQPHVVTGSHLERRRGLHSPLLTHGNFPVVDGVVTSFNTRAVVAIDGAVLPYVLPACAATDTCGLLRRVVVRAACAFGGALHTHVSACKGFKYIDGLEVHPPPASTSSAVAVAVGALGLLLGGGALAVEAKKATTARS